jgi:hypothetical protein
MNTPLLAWRARARVFGSPAPFGSGLYWIKFIPPVTSLVEKSAPSGIRTLMVANAVMFVAIALVITSNMR